MAWGYKVYLPAVQLDWLMCRHSSIYWTKNKDPFAFQIMFLSGLFLPAFVNLHECYFLTAWPTAGCLETLGWLQFVNTHHSWQSYKLNTYLFASNLMHWKPDILLGIKVQIVHILFRLLLTWRWLIWNYTVCQSLITACLTC